MRLLLIVLLSALGCGILPAQDPNRRPPEPGANADPDELPVPTAPATPISLGRSPGVQAIQAVHQGYAEIAAKVWPSIVTVRVFRRAAAPAIAAAGEADASTRADVTPSKPSAASASGPAMPVDGAELDAGGWVADAEPTYPGFVEYGALTGWVVREDGEILTCNHGLVQPDGSPPDLIDIETNDYQRIVVERVGIEPTVNLAILQAMVWPNGHAKKLQPLEFADANSLLTGHTLLAFGDPSGPERFMQAAMFISHPARDCYQDLLSQFYMQVGMVAHPQAYGGPLLDVHGKVAGIIAPRQIAPGVWAESQRLGIEFALPAKIVSGLYEAIRHVRSFRSPWLGFAVMSRPELAKARGMAAYKAMQKPRGGILIENVYEPSQAATVGLRPNDWLVTFDETRIFTPVDFQRQLYLAGIGTKVRIEIFRAGETMWRELVIEERPAAARPR